MAKGKYLKKKQPRFNGMAVILLLLLISLGSMLLWKACSAEQPDHSDTTPATTESSEIEIDTQTPPPEETTEIPEETTTAPTEPFVPENRS